MTKSLISIVLPIYNQADHIQEIMREYESVMSKIPNPYEFILVINGCSDNSLEICQSLLEKYPVIRVVESKNPGWGSAVKLGLQKALGDLICYTNSARTNPQDLVLLILYAIANPGTVIKANRKIRESWKRRLGSLLYNLECRSLFDLSYWDINGTPKVFPRKDNKLMELTREDDLIDAEFNIICRREDYKILEVPILSTKRHGGKTTTNYQSAIKMYWGIMKMYLDIRKSNK